MIDHLSLGVPDLKKGQAFYDSVLATLGYWALQAYDQYIGYGGDDGAAVFWLDQVAVTDVATSGTHIAFKAPSEDSVRRFFDLALSLGAQSDGTPGNRGCKPPYFGAAIIDPFGHRIELAFRPSHS